MDNLLTYSLVALIFILDLLTPRSFAMWFLYALPLYLAAQIWTRVNIILLAVLCTTLTAAGFFLELPGSVFAPALFNHIAPILLGWIIFLMIHRNKRLIREHESEMEVSQRIGEQFKEQEAFISSIFRSVPAGIGLVRERVFLYMNDSLERLTGYSARELEGRSTRILYPNDTEFDRVGRVYDPLRQGLVISTEGKWMRKGGEVFDVHIFMSPLDPDDRSKGYVFSAFDITDRKRMDDELASEKRKFETLSESTPDIIFVLDPQMRYTYLNKASENIIGYPREMMIGKRASELKVPEPSLGVWEESFEKAIRMREPIFAESELPQPGGASRYFMNVNVPVFADDGSLECVLGFAHEITELKQAQMVLQNDLDKSRRLSDIGFLAATVAHELRNPLGVIKVANYNMRRKNKSRDLDRHLDNIDKKILQAEAIINNLLFYSRLRTPHYEKVSPYSLLHEIVEPLRQGFPEIVFSERLDKVKGLKMDADPTQLAELCSNILNNACDACKDRRGEVEVEAAVSEGVLRVDFSDNGVGMDGDQLSKLFQPFYSTKSKGTGLGLTVSKQIINLHNGSIDVKSAQDEGTTVTIKLPLKKK
ncbi:MAG: PAS domain S-box protein [Deltaproteobacteria bacterium]